MKKQFLILILLLSSIANAQFGNTFESATLQLRNNETLKGKAKILTDRTIKFRQSKNDEKVIYNHTTVKELEIFEDGKFEVYKYKIIVGKRPILVKVIKEYEGTINLYAIDFSVTSGTGPLFITDNFKHFYANKGTGDVVIKLGSSQQVYGGPYFKKTSVKFFKDCPSLVKKIKSKEYNRRRHIVEIIEYYNENCGIQ